MCPYPLKRFVKMFKLNEHLKLDVNRIIFQFSIDRVYRNIKLKFKVSIIVLTGIIYKFLDEVSVIKKISAIKKCCEDRIKHNIRKSCFLVLTYPYLFSDLF